MRKPKSFPTTLICRGKLRLKTKSTAYAVDFSMQKCHKPSIYLGLRHFLCYNRSIKVGDGDRTYDDFEYRKKT